MKKILMIVFILGIIVGCGAPKVKFTTNEYKNEVINKILKNDDQKAKQEYEETTAELKIAMEKGSKEAKQEYEEWSSLLSFKRSMQVKVISSPTRKPNF